MSSKVALAIVATVALLGSVGCSGTMTRAEHEREMQALKEYNEQLEKAAAEGEKYKIAFKQLQDDYIITHAEQEMYDQLAKDLTLLLKGMKFEPGETPLFDKTRQVWTFGTDLLFESGKDTISAKGKEMLKLFADKYKGQNINFRIVGHTDRDPIAKPPTKKENPTGMNIELSVNRAITVSATLKGFGIVETRMMVEGQGNNQPVAANDNKAENKKKNRRVEIFIVPSTGTTPANYGTKGTKK